jgi:hypothetical protein
MKARIIKGGKVKPNTIEVNPNLCHIETFNEKILRKAGFSLISISITAFITRRNTKKQCIKLMPGLQIAHARRILDCYSVPPIASPSVEKKLKELLKYDKDVVWGIRTMKIKKMSNNFTATLKIIGTKRKRAIVVKIGNIPHTLVNIEDIMRELADLFVVSCFYRPGQGCGPIMCDSE